jgi:hypothetical protein
LPPTRISDAWKSKVESNDKPLKVRTPTVEVAAMMQSLSRNERKNLALQEDGWNLVGGGGGRTRSRTRGGGKGRPNMGKESFGFVPTQEVVVFDSESTAEESKEEEQDVESTESEEVEAPPGEAVKVKKPSCFGSVAAAAGLCWVPLSKVQ